VLGFTFLASILSGLLFGVLPSLYAGRIYALGARGASGTTQQTCGSRAIRETLVAAQVMLTIVLLTASVSVGRAFFHLMRADRGFSAKSVVTVSVSLEGTTHQLSGKQLPYFEEALARIRRLPGIESASATVFLPLYAKGFIGGPFGIDGRTAPRNSIVVPILPDYFRVMSGGVLYGREFTDAEMRPGARVAIVNDHFAGTFGAPPDAVGRQLTNDDRSWKIIGVVKAMDYDVEGAGADSNQVFLPARDPGGFFSTFVARVDGRTKAEDRLAIVRDTIRSVDTQVPVFGVETMEQRLDAALARPKFYRTALMIFAAFALLLVVIGIYGIVSYAVVQRTREMGVRMAIGATPARLRGILLGQGLVTVAAGAIPGVAGAMLSGRFLASLIEGAKSADAATYAVAVLFISLVASISIWMATRRIAGLDIMEILRAE